jgi:hypothetical protein
MRAELLLIPASPVPKDVVMVCAQRSLVFIGTTLLAVGCGGDPPPQRPDDPEGAQKAREEMMRQHQQEFKDRKVPAK